MAGTTGLEPTTSALKISDFPSRIALLKCWAEPYRLGNTLQLLPLGLNCTEQVLQRFIE